MSDWIYDWNNPEARPLEWSGADLLDRTAEAYPEAAVEWRESLAGIGVRCGLILVEANEAGFSKVQQLAEPGEVTLRLALDGLEPEALARLVCRAARAGVGRLLLDDEGGHLTPSGVERLLRFAGEALRLTRSSMQFDWSGGNRHDLAVANALTALRCGASRVHTGFFGLGRAAGFPATDQMLVNLRLLGALSGPFPELRNVGETACRLFDHVLTPNYPVLGADAFRTGTGVHAAAIIKAEKRGDTLLADQIYSGVPAGWFGFHQQIEIGPMAGASNVIFWLNRKGLPTDPEYVDALLQAAKTSDRVLEDKELCDILSISGLKN